MARRKDSLVMNRHACRPAPGGRLVAARNPTSLRRSSSHSRNVNEDAHLEACRQQRQRPSEPIRHAEARYIKYQSAA